jgi:hypothetical protein
MFGRKGKDVSERKMRSWQAKNRPDKIVAVLKSGSHLSKLKALEILGEINMSQIKKEIIACFDDTNANIALKATDVLESMGVTPEERKLIADCRARLNATKES